MECQWQRMGAAHQNTIRAFANCSGCYRRPVSIPVAMRWTRRCHCQSAATRDLPSEAGTWLARLAVLELGISMHSTDKHLVSAVRDIASCLLFEDLCCAAAAGYLAKHLKRLLQRWQTRIM